MDTNVEVAARILRIVTEASGQKIKGAELAPLIKYYCSSFSPQSCGCKNLREFVSRFVPEIAVVGSSGADVIFGLTSQVPPTGTQQQVEVDSESHSKENGPVTDIAVDTASWKTFCSPRGIYRLLGHSISGETKVISQSSVMPGPPWKEILSCPAQVHTEIAKQFADAQQDGAIRAALVETIAMHGSWYSGYMSAIDRFGLSRAWGETRRKRLFQEMRDAFEREGVPFRFSSLPHASPRPNLVPPPTLGNESAQELLRIVAAAAIQKMSVSELRNLSIPLGYVVEFLRR